MVYVLAYWRFLRKVTRSCHDRVTFERIFHYARTLAPRPHKSPPLAQSSQEMLIFAQTNDIFLCVNSFHDWSSSPWRF